MKKLQVRLFAKRFAVLGVMGLMAATALIPATTFAATTQPATCATGDAKCVIAAGDKLIAERLTALGTLHAKVSSDVISLKITSAQAGPLQSDGSTNESGLTTLKTKLDAETTALAARKDVAAIYAQFRIYAVVLPRDYRTIEYDVELNTQTKLQAAIPAIQTAITAAPASEQARLNTLFSDYQKHISAASAQLDPLPNDFLAMTPDAFNQTRTSYEATRKAVDAAEQAARADLHQAAKDLNQMAKIAGIKK
jgi:hypothetical protein